ncbi:hypothetical protein HWV07_00925 [Natronomonas salina]|uniref:hypothetical protein n=1 Tax=Natronomonas salina TaxID=1710540 RepID=UPI0015B68664|nr:hypothetical protein [Natronomonas salina]QLD87673.1 hypothetical protein HWV07_00925 [Natronomonas salina]
MATKPPVECPLCRVELEASRDFEDHLVEDHRQRELAEAIVSQWEDTELGMES